MVTLRRNKSSYLTDEEMDGNFEEIAGKLSKTGGVVTGPVVFDRRNSIAISEFSIEFKQSGSIVNAGRVLWSQGSIYGLALSINSSAGATAFADLQWVQCSGGALQSTPLRLRYSGDVEIPVGALLTCGPRASGYGAGAGGTVIQPTSKSTAVTLNKPCGQITLHSAALAAGASAVFTLNSTAITSTDTLDVNAVGTANYSVTCLATGVGYAILRVTNISAVSLAESVAINYCVGKGSAS